MNVCVCMGVCVCVCLLVCTCFQDGHLVFDNHVMCSLARVVISRAFPYLHELLVKDVQETPKTLWDIYIFQPIMVWKAWKSGFVVVGACRLKCSYSKDQESEKSRTKDGYSFQRQVSSDLLCQVGPPPKSIITFKIMAQEMKSEPSKHKLVRGILEPDHNASNVILVLSR